MVRDVCICTNRFSILADHDPCISIVVVRGQDRFTYYAGGYIFVGSTRDEGSCTYDMRYRIFYNLSLLAYILHVLIRMHRLIL